MIKSSFLFALLILFTGCHEIRKPNTEGPSAISEVTPASRAHISFRIGVPQWLSETRFNELLDLLEKHRGVTDEITFFTSATHAPLRPDVFRERASILKLRMEQARKHGYRTGINILATIGHHNENLENSLKGNYTFMTNIDGQVCQGSYCPNDENMRDYVRTIYEHNSPG